MLPPEQALAKARTLMVAAAKPSATTSDQRELQNYLVSQTRQTGGPLFMSSLIDTFFVQFQNLQDRVIDALLDLCEDEDQEIRIAGIKGLASTAIADMQWVSGNTGVLVQLLGCPPRETRQVKKALHALLGISPLDVFNVMVDDCKSAAVDSGASRRLILDFLLNDAKTERVELLESGRHPDCEASVSEGFKEALQGGHLAEDEADDIMAILETMKRGSLRPQAPSQSSLSGHDSSLNSEKTGLSNNVSQHELSERPSLSNESVSHTTSASVPRSNLPTRPRPATPPIEQIVKPPISNPDSRLASPIESSKAPTDRPGQNDPPNSNPGREVISIRSAKPATTSLQNEVSAEMPIHGARPTKPISIRSRPAPAPISTINVLEPTRGSLKHPSAIFSSTLTVKPEISDPIDLPPGTSGHSLVPTSGDLLSRIQPRPNQHPRKLLERLGQRLDVSVEPIFEPDIGVTLLSVPAPAKVSWPLPNEKREISILNRASAPAMDPVVDDEVVVRKGRGFKREASPEIIQQHTLFPRPTHSIADRPNSIGSYQWQAGVGNRGGFSAGRGGGRGGWKHPFSSDGGYPRYKRSRNE